MKLSKLYSNRCNVFEDIEFNDGLNVVVGEIRSEKNKNQDSHNLGKSKLAELIDFSLLKGRNKSQFLFKNFEIFNGFVFFLEIKLNSGSYLTVRRSVEENSKISFIKHEAKFQDYTSLPEKSWPYSRVPIDKAKAFLDSQLNLTSLGSWDYRAAVGYALRRQEDFVDIFQLNKFRGSHISWKPYLGHILGFNATFLTQNYELKSALEQLKEEIDELKTSLGLDEQGTEILNDALTIKKQKIQTLQAQLDSFDFNEVDTQIVNEITSEIDEQLEELNRARYYIKSNIRSLNKSMSSAPSKFDLKSTELLFKQSGVMFGEQISKTYEQLLEFNRKITTERARYVKEQVIELEEELAGISLSIEALNKEKSEKASQLTKVNLFEKFKSISNHLISVNVEVNELEKKLDIAREINAKNKKYKGISENKEETVELIGKNKELVTSSSDNIYKSIKDYFSDFVKTVLNKDATLSTVQNQEGNLEFRAGFINNNSLTFTSESEGHSYKKILCMAFDISVYLSYVKDNYIRFLYHDGGLETLDNRKKVEFLNYVRTMCETMGVQYIITVIDSDIPPKFSFDTTEKIVTLHDEGDSGLLFKMPAW